MDLHIFDLYMLYQTDTERQSCILDDNRVVRPNIQVNMNKLDDFVFHDIHYRTHTVTDDTGYLLAMANMLFFDRKLQVQQ